MKSRSDRVVIYIMGWRRGVGKGGRAFNPGHLSGGSLSLSPRVSGFYYFA